MTREPIKILGMGMNGKNYFRKTKQPLLQIPTLLTLWLVLEILFYLLRFILPDSLYVNLFQELLFVPERDLPVYNISVWDMLVGKTNWQGSRPFTMFSYSLLHQNFSHLIWNLTFGLVFGKVVYHSLGALRWLSVYLAAVWAGALAHVLTAEPEVGIIGASAGVAGFLGAALILALRGFGMPPPFHQKQIALSFILLLVVINLASGLVYQQTSGVVISYYGHLGGFLAGAMATEIFMLGKKPTIRA